MTEPDPRYVIGRDGVFATLYDRHENRLVVENSTEAHCRRVKAELDALWQRLEDSIDRALAVLNQTKENEK